MKKWFFGLLILAGAALSAAEKNLIANGRFEGGTSDVPYYWYYDYSRGSYFPEGGPDNMGYVLFTSPVVKREAALRQGGLVLIPGEKYRLSGKVRTKGFSARQPRILIHDTGWYHEATVGGFPSDTPWKEFSRVVTIPRDSKKGEFGIVLYLRNFKGEIAFADVKLIALTEKGKAGSSSSLDRLGSLKILEIMAPRLHEIPYGTKTLSVFWGQDGKRSQLTAAVDGKNIGTLPYVKGWYQLPAKPGRHTVKLTAFFDGKKAAEKNFEYTVLPAETKVAEKRLNAFTTELMNRELKGAKSITFTVPRRTWIYFKFGTKGKVNASLSGIKDPLITEKYPRNEAQRRLDPGEYTITFRQPYTGNLTLRTVPVIYKYAGINGRTMEGIGGSDLPFHDKYVFGVFNTMGARGVPEKLRPYTASLGMECVDNLTPPSRDTYSKENVEKFKARLLSPKQPFFRPSSQWVEFDEYFWPSNDGLLVAAEALPSLKNPYKKSLFHWFGGASGPSAYGIHHKVMNAFMNAGGGRGYVAYEVYFKSKPTEQRAQEELDNTMKGAARRMNGFVPGSNRAFGFIYGNFHQLPILSIDYHPGVNYKYFLDMQYRTVAMDPLFNGIGLTGYWGFNYVNEEIARWCCELVRHYVLEGRTDRLSDKYGYTYLLPHLQNGDFENGLKGWTPRGDITTGTHPNFGALNELRWGGSTVGNRFAVFKGHAGKPNTLTQTAVKLTPGKPYYLEFITADYDDTKAGKVAPRFFAISVDLPGAKILKKFDYVDKRKKGRYGATTAKTNYRYIRFVPTASTQKLIFKDAGKEGENLLMNYVRVAPYFAE